MYSTGIIKTVWRGPPAFRSLEALKVPEIVNMVMSFLESDGDLFNSSLVCKTWSPVALNNLWRSLTSVVPLFMLLGEMGVHDWDRSSLFFTDAILAANWTQFERYSRKVRRIANEHCTQDVEPGALIQVINNRPASIPYIFPRLTEIEWIEDPHRPNSRLLHLVPLMSPTLTSFDLTIDGEDSRSVTGARVVLRHLALLPGLKLQHLRTNWLDSSKWLTAAVCEVLRCQSESLQSFAYQVFDLDEPLLQSVSRLPNLVDLQLKFSGVGHHTSEEFHDFNETLAAHCTSLEEIRFCVTFGPRDFGFYCFRPLTKLEGLKKICLECPDMELLEKDIVLMGEGWRSLVKLELPQSWIPLSWFVTIAEHFPPTLQEIYVEITVDEDLDSECAIPKPFTDLKRISCLRIATPQALPTIGTIMKRLVTPGTTVECAMWMLQPLQKLTANSVKWKGVWEAERNLRSPSLESMSV
ncbi:hypothetical protein FRB90_009796 [Tulasnella sp. 427]|nr:hypothetical protein FRB90_009796 [Tulasnella sp. 427]